MMRFTACVQSSTPIPKPTTAPLLSLPVLTQTWILTKPYLLGANGPVLFPSDPSPMHLFAGSAAGG